MSKMPLFFVLVVAVIVVAASFRYVQQRREKQANDAAPLLQKRVIVGDRGMLSYKGTAFVAFTPDP